MRAQQQLSNHHTHNAANHSNQSNAAVSSLKTRSKSKPKKKHKSFKQKILTARRMKQDTDDNEKQHEKRSSLQMHKMRMIRAVQEAISEDDAFCMMMYGLRCSEEVFEIISRFHVMPFEIIFHCCKACGCHCFVHANCVRCDS
eukprot:105781_1